jgi:sn-glycerol 3-phosphate transport system substrate-binding protein
MNNRRQSRLFVMAPALALALGLSSCATTPAVEADGPIALDFWYSVTGPAADVLVDQVAAFNSSNEHDITVEAIFQGDYAETAAKLTNAVQSGDTPALLQGGDTYASYLYDSGLAKAPGEITSFDGTAIDGDTIVPAAANYYTFDDELWAVPLMVSQPAVFYDPAVLTAANLDPAQMPADIDELFSWADTIYAATGTPGLVFQQNEWWNEQFTAAAGANYCTPANGLSSDAATAFDYVSDELVSVWTHYQSSLAAGAIANVGSDGAAAQNLFSSGGSAMLLASSASLGTTSAAAAFDIEAMPVPTSSADGGAVPGGSAVWILGEGREDDENAAALDFAEFMGSADTQKTIFESSGYLPSSVSAIENLKDGDLSQAQLVLLEQLTSTPSTSEAGGCHNGAFGQSRADVRSAIQAIANGMNVRQSLEEAQRKGNTAIAEYNERASN